MNYKPNFMKKEDFGGRSGASVKYEAITRYMVQDLITFNPETEMIEVI